MKVKMKLVSLTLIGSRKNYTVQFRDGFNYISGHTSTGKTSILEMIDYALGSKGHKSYIEMGSSCSHAELIIFIDKEKFKIRRQLFDFKAAVVVEDWNEEKQKFLFYNRFEIDTPSNPRSLSAFLIEKMGLTNMTISGQTFSFRDLYKYCYIKQTEIDNEDILGEKAWEKNFKRKATFEIIFNIYDKTLEELIIDSPRKNLGAQASKNEDEEFKDEIIFNSTIKYLCETAESMKDTLQLIVVSNGYPDFIPEECIVAEFDADGRDGLPRGLIDDATV